MSTLPGLAVPKPMILSPCGAGFSSTGKGARLQATTWRAGCIWNAHCNVSKSYSYNLVKAILFQKLQVCFCLSISVCFLTICLPGATTVNHVCCLGIKTSVNMRQKLPIFVPMYLVKWKSQMSPQDLGHAAGRHGGGPGSRKCWPVNGGPC